MTAKRILILSFYYPPDLSACSFRAAALVKALGREPSRKITVDVITTLPNRYSSFTSDAREQETAEQLTIRRIKLPPHKSGMLDQALAFVHFARQASRLAEGQPYDLVFATSSRLMTAFLGAWISRRVRAPLYLDLRDIFADTITDLLPTAIAFPIKPLLLAIERWTLNRAAHVNLVSPGFQFYFQSRYPEQSFSYFTNGIDDEFLPENIPTKRAERTASGPIRVLYAGNIGEGQGLDGIIPAVASRLTGRATFRLIGDGGRRPQLEKALARAGVSNVEMVGPMSRDALIKEYMASAVLFMHLNDNDAFKKVLPSKLFEYAALGKPIWAGVSGYPARFLDEEVSNAAVFPPCDPEQAVKAFEQLEIRDNPRVAFVRRYAREPIMRAMATNLVAHVAARSSV